MKIKPEYKMRTVGGKHIIISTAGVNFSGVITANDTAEFIWRMLEKGAEAPEIITALAAECKVDESVVKQDVEDFLARLSAARIIEE